MTILRCNSCRHLAEFRQDSVSAPMPCPRCGAAAHAYETVPFVRRLVEKLAAAQTELRRLSAPAVAGEPAPVASAAPLAIIGLDPHNSRRPSSELPRGTIHDWFQRRGIQVRINPRAVDTAGFFDEVGVAIGKRHGVLKEVVDRIRLAQRKGFASSTIRLDKKSHEQAELIVDFCRSLRDYSFVAKCVHLKKERLIRLVLQKVPSMREFFNGDWLEWHAFITLLESAQQHGRRYACARNLVITLQNDETYELGVFFLLDGNRPVCIDSKRGEFREDIERCLALRKRLGIRREDFVLCAVGLGPEQATRLSGMYDLTFSNEQDLPGRLARVFDAQGEARRTASLR